MNKFRVEGSAKQVKGSLKEAIGKLTGDKKTQLEGAAEKQAGKLQSKLGEVVDKAKPARK